jgi:hypothetical protein
MLQIVWLTILVEVGLRCWLESPLKNGVMCGVIGGLIYGVRAVLSMAADFMRFG